MGRFENNSATMSMSDGQDARILEEIALTLLFRCCFSHFYFLSSCHVRRFLAIHYWQANLRILEIREIKSVPSLPLSHTFVERLIGTIHRKRLDQTLFWNADDLNRKLEEFRQYYNAHRVPTALDGDTPSESSSEPSSVTVTSSSLGGWVIVAGYTHYL